MPVPCDRTDREVHTIYNPSSASVPCFSCTDASAAVSAGPLHIDNTLCFFPAVSNLPSQPGCPDNKRYYFPLENWPPHHHSTTMEFPVPDIAQLVFKIILALLRYFDSRKNHNAYPAEIQLELKFFEFL